MFLPHSRVKVSIVGSLRDREVACSASDRQGSNFESCVWRAVSSQSSHHPQEVLLAQFSLYVHKGGLKPDSFHFILSMAQCLHWMCMVKIPLLPCKGRICSLYKWEDTAFCHCRAVRCLKPPVLPERAVSTCWLSLIKLITYNYFTVTYSVKSHKILE